ncbi:PKD domain-containing protein [Microbacterium sp. XT11]|uniref:PKD domain-containing protein n=1 Tax=Microbacterium sp. XT11 TaxID=367477 RepID=UPI00083729AD|nr:PKD domain-containing protein [Microbacterium sp. XT11]
MGGASIATRAGEGRASDSRWRSVVAFAVGAVVASGLLVAVPGAAQAAVPAAKAPLLERTDDVVTSDPLPTVQIDSGYVWAQATIGNTVYAAGSFSNARAALAEPGTNLTPRSNILAYDITTGGLLPFAPVVNGVIKSIAASPDGKRVYIGGTFTQVNGANRYNFAALDAATGAVVPGFAPAIGGTGVYAIAATADTVYLGGFFTQANGVARKNLAALAASNGALQPWAPTADRQVDTMVVEPGGNHVIAGGRFYRVNGAVQRGLAALDPSTGALDTTWAAATTVQNGTPDNTANGYSGIFGLTTDDASVYGTGWSLGNTPETRGNLEGAFAAEAGSGAVRWVADCHGDSYGVYSTGTTVYTTSHIHTCETANLWPEQSPRTWRYFNAFTTTAEGTLSRSLYTGPTYSDWSGTPSPSAYPVTPDFAVGTATGMGQAGLSITGAGDYIAVAGEFVSVNNKRYQGIVRFSTKPAGGAKQGPRLSGSSWAAPTVQGDVPVRVSIPLNWDRDNRDLTYQLLRSDTSQPVAQTTVASVWWDKGTVTLEDATAVAGTSYTYTVRAVDADGNAALSQEATVTAASGDTSLYTKTVRRDGAEICYPLGNAKTDWAGGTAPVFGTGVTASKPGAVTGTTGGAASAFNGTTAGRVSSPTAVQGDDDFAVEAWVKTTTTKGGKIFGYGGSQTGASNSNDRNLYMQNNGRLTFGVYPGTERRTISTTSAYNDGKWHHVVAMVSPAGMALYVDGKIAAQDASVSSAQKSYAGYWRIGYDTLSGWPSAPTSAAFSGTIDEFAVYPSALSAAQVATHFAVGKGLKAPSASFTSTADALSVAVDGSGSTVEAGQTATYAWNFGDGKTATGKTATHEFVAAGTYTVTLTVTDGRGLIGTSTAQVTVLAPNVAPVASFTSSVVDLGVSVDGAGSSDADGTVASYAWDWGDGSAAGSGVTASHTYAAAGTYTVTLTVTDDKGATGTKTAQVVVTDPPVVDPAVARDAFERSGSPGWGTADVGGVWTVAGGAVSAASVSDGAGRLALAAGSTRNVTLNAVSAKNVTLSADFRIDAEPSTGSTYAGLIARSTASGNYTTRVWFHTNGSVWLVIQKGSTVLSSYQVPGLTRGAGDVFTVKVDVSGDASTVVSAKVWKTGTAEPSGWQSTFTDTSGITTAGAVGVHASRASSATSTAMVTVDNFRVIDNH